MSSFLLSISVGASIYPAVSLPQIIKLETVEDADIPRFIKETEEPAAQQAFQSGMFKSEAEAIEIVGNQNNKLIDDLGDKYFLENWKCHNFLQNIVLDVHQKPSGYIWYTINENEAFIENIFVNKESRGQGIAGKVLQNLEIELRKKGIERISLHVFVDNTPAFNLYKRLGYQVKIQYHENSVMMSKILN